MNSVEAAGGFHADLFPPYAATREQASSARLSWSEPGPEQIYSFESSGHCLYSVMAHEIERKGRGPLRIGRGQSGGWA
jgi:hypothetical protein